MSDAAVYVTIKVDINDFIRIRANRYRETLLPIESWENEGGAL